MTNRNDCYLLIESGPLLAEAKKYRKAYSVHADKKIEYVKKLGGTGWFNDLRDGIYAIAFDGKKKAPEGWIEVKKLKGGRGYRPHAKSKDMDKFKSIGDAPHCMEFLTSLKWPDRLTYEYDDCKGSMRVGGFFGPQVCYYSLNGPMVLVVGDVAVAARDQRESHKRYYPKSKLRFTSPVNPKVPEGTKRILKEEWDLMVARHKQKRAA